MTGRCPGAPRLRQHSGVGLSGARSDSQVRPGARAAERGDSAGQPVGIRPSKGGGKCASLAGSLPLRQRNRHSRTGSPLHVECTIRHPMLTLIVVILVAATPVHGQAAEHQGRTLAEWQADLASSIQVERLLAARSIGEMAVAGDAGAGKAILEILGHDDSSVRYWAAVAAIHLPDTASGQREALQRALDDPAPEVQVQAARALAVAGGEPQALRRLEALLAHRNPGVRLQAVHALDEIGDAAAPLTDALRKAVDDPFDYVQRVARHALWALGERPCPYRACE